MSIEKSLLPKPIRDATASSPMARADVLDHAANGIAIGSKLGIHGTKKFPGEDFKLPWPPLIKMDEAVKAKVEKLLNP